MPGCRVLSSDWFEEVDVPGTILYYSTVFCHDLFFAIIINHKPCKSHPDLVTRCHRILTLSLTSCVETFIYDGAVQRNADSEVEIF
jgi:hypothetical protein